jgi:hypothetical protein
MIISRVGDDFAFFVFLFTLHDVWPARHLQSWQSSPTTLRGCGCAPGAVLLRASTDCFSPTSMAGLRLLLPW